MASISVKLWENAFQTIPNMSFFDAQKFGDLFSDFFVFMFFSLEELIRNFVASLADSPSKIIACSLFIFFSTILGEMGKSGTDRFCS